MNADIDAHSEVDLLIAGAGPAGMTTALVASLEGLDVLLCENLYGDVVSDLCLYAPKPYPRNGRRSRQ